MIKFIIKCIIVLLAIQSAMDYLRKQEIIEGSVQINYQTVQKKLLALIQTKKVSASIVDFVSDKINNAFDEYYQNNEVFNSDKYNRDSPSYRLVCHVVDNGETLNEISQKYGVHWRVIKKLNHINNEHKLMKGQKLQIPSKMDNLI